MPLTYSAEIHITGICAFAFEPDGKACTLLMPRTNLTKGKFPNLKNQERPDLHAPTLVCPTRYLSLGKDGQDKPLTTLTHDNLPGEDGHALAYFDLTDLDLELHSDSAEGITKKAVGDTSDFAHTIPLLQTLPGTTFKEECFLEDLEETPAITRLRFDRGLLFTRELAKETNGEVICSFRPFDQSFGTTLHIPQRRVADFVTLRLEGLQEDLVIRSKSGERVTISNPEGGTVHLSLTHFDDKPDLLFETRILDYLWYYELLDLPANVPNERALYVPWKSYQVAEALTPSSSACPPGEGTRGNAETNAILGLAEHRDRILSVARSAASGNRPAPAEPSLASFGFPEFERGVHGGTSDALLASRSIVGPLSYRGVPDSQNLFPHCVRIGLDGAEDMTAILWNKDVIITAAHYFGENPNLNFALEVCTHDRDGNFHSRQTVPGAVRHAGFRRGSYCNDLAVLLLDKPLDLGTLQLLPPNQFSRLDKAIVVGFGEDSSGDGTPDGRQHGPVRVVDKDYQFDSIPPCDDREELVIEPDGSSPCVRDSGGGLYAKRGAQYKLAGMISRYKVPGPPCALAPVVCIRFNGRYPKWINKTAKELLDKFRG